MASQNTTGTLNGTDLLSQIITVYGPGGVLVEIPISIIDQMDISAICSVINYGSQLGACFIMLVVMLAMTPRARLRRVPSIVSVLALALNLIRVLLISLFYISDWNRFYTRVTGDIEFVARHWWNLSVVATVLSIPITVLIELSLIIQAWSMLQLWPTVQKWIALGLSVMLVLLTVAFSFFNSIMQALWILYSINEYLYAKAVYIGLFTASISWFCFLFIVRLLIHMYTNRSILPSLKGLKAMDMLIMTNGILMLIPGLSSRLPHFSPNPT
ncbi:GPCR fungal pheromone mating factor [Cercophora scortea]|uniref:GPCR fungal pheromone mating factor n=1 Tax=Cercophora scortea TaxID=314031 RepID=A0AAE0MIT4_9PEZI|nr:GPCR fungal pheromone mating factor [Cercophora scortea]